MTGFDVNTVDGETKIFRKTKEMATTGHFWIANFHRERD